MSKYNLTNNLEYVVIFLNIVQMSTVLNIFRWCFQNSKKKFNFAFWKLEQRNLAASLASIFNATPHPPKQKKQTAIR